MVLKLITLLYLPGTPNPANTHMSLTLFKSGDLQQELKSPLAITVSCISSRDTMATSYLKMVAMMLILFEKFDFKANERRIILEFHW